MVLQPKRSDKEPATHGTTQEWVQNQWGADMIFRYENNKCCKIIFHNMERFP